MNKVEAIKRIGEADEAKESIVVGVFPKELECDICHKHPKYLFPDAELGICVCAECAQLITRLRALPAEIVEKLF